MLHIEKHRFKKKYICFLTSRHVSSTHTVNSFDEYDWDQKEKHCWPDRTDLDGVCWADIHMTPLTTAVHHTCSSSTHKHTHTDTPVRQWCVQIYGQNVVSHHVERLWGWLWKSVRVCACVHVHKAEEMSNIVQCEACLLCNNTGRPVAAVAHSPYSLWKG